MSPEPTELTPVGSVPPDQGFWLMACNPAAPDAPLEKMQIPVEIEAFLQGIMGVKGRRFADQLFTQTVAMNRTWTEEGAVLPTIVETLAALEPQGATQSMLAVQLIGVHSAATAALDRASRPGITPDEAERQVNRASKLMRLFAQQVELLARLQGKIAQQRVVVEKVDVGPGGQAIVGTVTGGRV